MNTEILKAHLVRDEGRKTRLYRCSAGKLTIGVGWNIEDRGLPDEVIDLLLDVAVRDVLADLDRALPEWRTWPEAVQMAIANMAFNLGWPRLSKFVGMLAALRRHDWAAAADAALGSLWARQVGDRARRIAAQIRSAAAV